MQGVKTAAIEVDAQVVGGNLARSDKFSAHTTVIGVCEYPVLRKGAKTGDTIFVSGPLGGASLGLHEQLHDLKPDFLNHWLSPSLPLMSQRALASHAHAAIDISDGLVADLRQLLGNNLGAELNSAAIPTPAGFEERCLELNLDAKQISLGAAEDYQILCTSARTRMEGFFAIGTVTDHRTLRCDGTALRQEYGYDHFEPGL